jgi:hypothetical protein
MKKILMKIIESSNTALKEGDTIKAMVSAEPATRITIVKGKRRKPGNPTETKPPRNSKPPLWFQLWSANVFEPFKKEVHERLDKIENTLARHEAKLNKIDEILVRNKLDGILERNNLK